MPNKDGRSHAHSSFLAMPDATKNPLLYLGRDDACPGVVSRLDGDSEALTEDPLLVGVVLRLIAELSRRYQEKAETDRTNVWRNASRAEEECEPSYSSSRIRQNHLFVMKKTEENQYTAP